MHQGAEYLVGIVFVAQGLQSPTPVVPSVVGGLILVNTACAKGPLSAFRVFGKSTHRILDVFVIGAVIVAAVQPWVAVESTTRLIMGFFAFALAFIWIQSDFSPSARELRRAGAPRGEPVARVAATSREPDGTVADTIGRTAGRLAGKGVNMYRARKARAKQRQ